MRVLWWRVEGGSGLDVSEKKKVKERYRQIYHFEPRLHSLYLNNIILLVFFEMKSSTGELVPVAAFVDEEHRTRTDGSQVYDREKKPIRIEVTVLEKGLGVAIQEK
ncbi:hypothetical protein SASPL_106655 [Salvia splendens]|uniref:Uncharacterized protein n=1 Tax=Salvia splendens TaxID=180675 RepID=A0A8X8YR27_SALSN|nr:hypothetical protein SASPL_106655 [Salvia splendens]